MVWERTDSHGCTLVQLLELQKTVRAFPASQAFSNADALPILTVGLHLGIHHLAGGDATVDHELVVARRDTFFAVFGIDVSLAMPIGRNPTFRPDEFDQEPPPVDSIVDFDIPYFRSSAMHWVSYERRFVWPRRAPLCEQE